MFVLFQPLTELLHPSLLSCYWLCNGRTSRLQKRQRHLSKGLPSGTSAEENQRGIFPWQISFVSQDCHYRLLPRPYLLRKLFLLHTVNCVTFCFWHCLWLLLCEISRAQLNGFVPNAQEKRVWSLTQMSLNVKVNGQMSRLPGTKTTFFGRFGGLRMVYVW